MEEYLVDKCPTCGHEKKGRRVIRLSGEHAKQWKAIQRQRARSDRVVLAGILLCLALGMGAMLATNWYLLPHWSEKWWKVLISFGILTLGDLLPAILVLIPYANRIDKSISSQCDTILINYGIRKDSGEPYVVVTE